MSLKRKRDGDSRDDVQADRKKKAKGGFKVGPDNLPDGTYKRKSKNSLSPYCQDAPDHKQHKRSKAI